MARKIKRADGRYSVQVYLGKDADGKRKYKAFYGSTQKEAAAKAEEYRAALGRGMDPERQRETFGTLLDALIAAKRAQGVRPKTLEIYASAKKHYAALTPRPAAELRSGDFQSVLNTLADWHDGRAPLSHRSLCAFYDIAKASYAQAIPEILLYNPLERVIIPAGAPAQQRLPITEAQQAWVRDTPHRAQRAAMLMLYAGLRRGEACALTWADIDLDAATIRVTKSFDLSAREVKTPKTAAGVRTVNIPQLLVDYLRTQQDGFLYVVHTATGAPFSANVWRQVWRSYMLDLNVRYGYGGNASKYDPAGLPILIQTFTAHQLRHTFCTMLYLSGVDVLTARDQMGHTDISTTLGIYTHLDKKYKRSSMDKLNDFLSDAARAGG